MVVRGKKGTRADQTSRKGGDTEQSEPLPDLEEEEPLSCRFRDPGAEPVPVGHDTGPAAALGPLRQHEEASTVFPGNLANLFIVSGVGLEEGGDGPVRVDVQRASGAKCGRCWTFSEKVGTLSPPEVCERCAEVLAQL